jgi:hypothetical protein
MPKFRRAGALLCKDAVARILHGKDGVGERRGRTRVERLRANRFHRASSMKQDNGTFGIIVGGLVALAAVFFIFGGGDFGGKKTVEGDQDLPPIASADQ